MPEEGNQAPKRDEIVWNFLQQWAWEIGAMKAYLVASNILARDFAWEVDDIANTVANFQDKTLIEAKEYLQKKVNNNISFYIQAMLNLQVSDINNFWWQDDILPAKFLQIVKNYHGVADDLTDECWEEYEKIFDYIVKAKQQVRLKYTLLAKKFSAEHQLLIAEKLFSLEEYELAMFVYQDIPIAAIKDMAKYWHDVAICLYNLRHPETETALTKAASYAENVDIPSYQSWFQEVKAGEMA